MKELIEKYLRPAVRKAAELYIEPAVKKVANGQALRAISAFWEKRVLAAAGRVGRKYLVPAAKIVLDRVLAPLAKTAVGGFVVRTSKEAFEKHVRPVTVDAFNKYVKPERRKLFRNALIAWFVLASAVFFNWAALAYYAVHDTFAWMGHGYDAVQEMFATDFSGTAWRIESEDHATGVYVRLAPQGTVELNSLEPANLVPTDKARWTRSGRNRLEIRVGDGRFSVVAPDQDKRSELTVEVLDGSAWRQKGGETGRRWYLVFLGDGKTKARQQPADPDRERLEGAVAPRELPALYFIRRMEVSIPGYDFKERCAEIVRMLQRKDVYLLWSVVRTKGAGADKEAYVLLKETRDGQPIRIGADDKPGKVPQEVLNAVALDLNEPNLRETLSRLSGNCGLGGSPVASDGHLNIPVLAMVLPEKQDVWQTDELGQALRPLVAKLAIGRNQAAGNVLVLNVPPGSNAGTGADSPQYGDFEGFVRASAREVEIEPPKPPRRRVIRKLVR